MGARNVMVLGLILFIFFFERKNVCVAHALFSFIVESCNSKLSERNSQFYPNTVLECVGAL